MASSLAGSCSPNTNSGVGVVNSAGSSTAAKFNGTTSSSSSVGELQQLDALQHRRAQLERQLVQVNLQIATITGSGGSFRGGPNNGRSKSGGGRANKGAQVGGSASGQARRRGAPGCRAPCGKPPDADWLAKAQGSMAKGYFPVTCGGLAGVFYPDQFGSGGKGKAIQLANGELLTLVEMELRGKNFAKTRDTYRNIHFEGCPILHLRNAGFIRRHHKDSCFCKVCTDGCQDKAILWEWESPAKKKSPYDPKVYQLKKEKAQARKQQQEQQQQNVSWSTQDHNSATGTALALTPGQLSQLGFLAPS